MEPALSSILLVFAHVVVLVVAGLAYFRRARIERPPIGVYNLRDVLGMAVVLVVMPPLYLHIPDAAVVAILASAVTAVLYFTLSPVLGRPWGTGAALALVAADLALGLWDRAGHLTAFLVLNNLLMVAVAVGVTNIWAQSGIRAREVALLAAGLAVYDLLATVVTPTMVEFFARVAALPLTPVVGWGSGAGMVGIGLGDLLLVLVWTLVAERTFGPRAGLAAAAGCLLVVLAMDMAFWLDLVNRPVPAMVLLGPVIVGQFALLGRRGGRTTEEYFAALAGEALPPPRPPRSADLAAALRLALVGPDGGGPDGGGRARYLAVVDGQVIAGAATAGEAVRAAGVAMETLGMRPDAVPTLVLSTATAEAAEGGALSASAGRA